VTEIIQLTDTARLRVEVDDDASNPRANGDYQMTGFVKIAGRGDSRTIDVAPYYDDPIRIGEAHDRLAGQPFARGWNDPVARWAKVYHGMHVEYDSEHGGYWFVDRQAFAENWPDLKPGSTEGLAKQAEVIAQEREQYRQWADGEVCGVILERLVTWARMLDDGTADRLDTRDEWEEVESVWGCYLDDTYTAQDVANESWELTDEESAALGLDAPVG
jgi:hypothetical protein